MQKDNSETADNTSQLSKLAKLQNITVRIITNRKVNACREPLFRNKNVMAANVGQHCNNVDLT